MKLKPHWRCQPGHDKNTLYYIYFYKNINKTNNNNLINNKIKPSTYSITFQYETLLGDIVQENFEAKKTSTNHHGAPLIRKL